MEFRLFNIDDINHTRIIKFLHDFYIDDSYEIKKVGMPSSNEYIIKFVPSIDISSLSKYFKSKRYDFTLKENKMKLTLKEKKLVKEYAKKLIGKRLTESNTFGVEMLDKAVRNRALDAKVLKRVKSIINKYKHKDPDYIDGMVADMNQNLTNKQIAAAYQELGIYDKMKDAESVKRALKGK